MDSSLPGSGSMGFSRQEYWSGLPFPSRGDLPNPGIEPGSPALQTDALPSELPGKPAKSLQSCLTLCDPVDCSLSGSSVRGILQARMLEWVAIPHCGDLPNPGIESVSLVSPALAGEFSTTSAPWEAHISTLLWSYSSIKS